MSAAQRKDIEALMKTFQAAHPYPAAFSPTPPPRSPTPIPMPTPSVVSFGLPEEPAPPAPSQGWELAMIKVEDDEENTVQATTAMATGDSSVDDMDVDDKQAEEATEAYLRLLGDPSEETILRDIQGAPLFTHPVLEHTTALAKGAKLSGSEAPFSQHGLIGENISDTTRPQKDRLVFWNISAPSSFFICGSQGSGKSHLLSCLLENSLVPSAANRLPRPLTGIVFHYDALTCDTGGAPCEAAWLASDRNLKVRVLCPPSNKRAMTKLYGKLANVRIQELRLRESDLNTTRMMDLMRLPSGGAMPLYMSVVDRLIREQRTQQDKFDYLAFKTKLSQERLTSAQLQPLKQRLDTLESFMVDGPAKDYDIAKGPSKQPARPENLKPLKSNSALVASARPIDWTPQSGTLTIVDLSCPCVTSEMACSLFNICLSLFLEQNPESVGRVIALDEAHKFMNGSNDSQTLTDSLLSVIRLQRHAGARVLIATQEPTISPKLMDLCSVTVCHRFTSPEWFDVLRGHIAAASRVAWRGAEVVARNEVSIVKRDEDQDTVMEDADDVGTLALGGGEAEIFSKIVSLRVGEALVFAPSALVGVSKPRGGGVGEVRRLGHGVMKVRVRKRVTADGGRSVMA